MATPAPIKCSECDFSTQDGLPTYDLVMRHLETHSRVAHPQGYAGQREVGGKHERFPRPTLDIDITEADWTLFKSQWERFKRSSRLVGQEPEEAASKSISRVKGQARRT